jgi:hypothetical protein
MQAYLFDVGRPEGRTRMPFGKHEGETLDRLPLSYLEWLDRLPDLRTWLAEAVHDEVERRTAPLLARKLEWERLVPDELPTARPCAVCGVELDAVEAALFAQAVSAGELVVTPDLPVNSPVEAAWRRWCETGGRPCRVREVTPAEWTPAG